MIEKIRLLPEAVANQIAAGEVVNRPASVVKEMIENSVDAGSRNITVRFCDGGKSLIQVVDDGAGMSDADARMAFERHATSKITTVDDIYTLSTFGFRGEALASIASVSEVQLKTRLHDRQVGTQIEICAGKFISQTPVSCPEGTQFVVRNLFYNVPARRKFLDKSSTESRHITAEYQRVALCNPDIGFTLYDGDSLLSKLPPAPLRQRIVGVIGKNISRNLLDLTADTSIVKVEGFVGRPESARQYNREQFLFVNGRYFKSPYFHKAVVSAYDKLIQPGTQPSYFLYLTIDTAKIDVNVHPQKTEVKFTDGSDIWQIINAATRESLARSGAVPSMDFSLDESVRIPVARDKTVYNTPRITANPEFNPFEKYGDEIQLPVSESMLPEYDPSPGDGPSVGERMASAGPTTRPVTDNITYVDSGGESFEDESFIEFVDTADAVQSQFDLMEEQDAPVMLVGGRYFATMVSGSLVLVDIPRAHEAVLYDRFLTMLGNNSSVSQQLLFPEHIAMSLDDLTVVKELADEFTAFGFDMKVGDDQRVEIKAVPADFSDIPVEQLVYDLLDSMRDGKGEEVRRKKAASTLASIGSMTRARPTGLDELGELRRQLLACENHSYTPSGRRVMAVISAEEIHKKFE